MKATGILWVPVAWIAKHFIVVLVYNQVHSCKTLFFEKMGRSKRFSDVFSLIIQKGHCGFCGFRARSESARHSSCSTAYRLRDRGRVPRAL